MFGSGENKMDVNFIISPKGRADGGKAEAGEGGLLERGGFSLFLYKTQVFLQNFIDMHHGNLSLFLQICTSSV